MERNSIVFINQATGYLTIDIINDFAERYKKTALIAGSVRVQNNELHPGVRWSKIATYNRSSPFWKALSWLWGTVQIFFLLATRYRSYEVFYISIPPTAYLLSLLLPQRFSLLVYDIYPDALQVFKISEKHPIYQFWAWANRRLFRRAHRIYTLGEGMAQVLSQYAQREKITVIPNWTDTSLFRPVAKADNPFVKEHQLAEQFVVMYSGNIGYTHNVEVLVQVAELLKAEAEVLFLIIGRGDRTTAIKQLITQKNLTNCLMLPFQPDDILPYSLAAADLAVITLADETAQISVPSKTYNFLAVGAPLLCIGSEDSEMHRLTQTFANGACFSKKAVQEIAQYIMQLKGDQKQITQLRQNSRAASVNFTSANAKRYLETYVQSLAKAIS
ncbi:MAG: glycosyltransferase family 4 protein [Bacteroidota bacterium]